MPGMIGSARATTRRALASLAFGASVALVATGALAQDVRIGNGTANDTQAAVNEKFGELIGKYAGDQVEVKAPAGVRGYEVLEVRYI